jgi:hypothetical protein
METTINVRTDILKKITLAAQKQDISCSEMIIVLIKKIMDDISDPGRIGKMVAYQKRRRPEQWHKFHLCAREDEYEYLLDLKKLLKKSASLIVACAADKFLDKPIISNNTDNYRYRNYLIIREIIDNIISWRLFWGFPPNLEKLLNQPRIERPYT